MTISKEYKCVLVVCFCILLGVITFHRQNMEHEQMESVRRHIHLRLEMPREGFLITMHNESGWQAAKELQRAFEIEKMHVVIGHVGHVSRMPMYTRYVMQTGRTDDLQIGNLNMLGCIETHKEVWSRISNTSYVFEHDAKPNENSKRVVETMLRDTTLSAWSVILLQKPNAFSTNSLVSPNNQFEFIGEIGQSCRNCIAYGSRGYIVTKEGAKILLDNYNPPVVQVDSYMSLLNMYHENFTLVWTRVQAVDWIVSWTTQQDILEMQTLNRWIKQKRINT